VWEWKEIIYREVKDLTIKEYVEKIRNDADNILSNNQIELMSITLKGKHQKIA
jgi:hypothetical protein